MKVALIIHEVIFLFFFFFSFFFFFFFWGLWDITSPTKDGIPAHGSKAPSTLNHQGTLTLWEYTNKHSSPNNSTKGSFYVIVIWAQSLAHLHTHNTHHTFEVQNMSSLFTVPSAILLWMACPTCSSFWYKWAQSIWWNPTSIENGVNSRAFFLATYISNKGRSWIST